VASDGATKPTGFHAADHRLPSELLKMRLAFAMNV
jgi:hypothetical protein